MIDKEKACTACSGSGHYGGKNCASCNGTGLEYSKDDVIEALEIELEKLKNTQKGKIIKIWWVFGRDTYSPCGGLDDLENTFETEDEAIEYAKAIKEDWEFVEVVNITEYLN
jgi:hypothetical protein